MHLIGLSYIIQTIGLSYNILNDRGYETMARATKKEIFSQYGIKFENDHIESPIGIIPLLLVGSAL